MRDGVIHNLTRQQRLKSQQAQMKRSREQSPGSPQLELNSIFGNASPETSLTDTAPAASSGQALKGILKPPRVRFPEELGTLERPDTQFPIASSPPYSTSLTYSSTLETAHETPQTPPLPPPPRLPSPPPPPPEDAPRPPSLFNKAIETDEYLNEAAYRLYTKFIDDLSDFVDQQGEVVRTRLRVQEKRQELKRLRENVSKCDMLLVDYLRKCIISNMLPPNDSELIALFEAAQTARDVVGPFEADYEPLEVNLGAEEYKLREKYEQIEGRFEHFFRLNANPSSHQSIPSHIQYEDPSTAPSASGDKDWLPTDPRDSGLFYGALIGDQVGIGQVPLQAAAESPKTTDVEETVQTRKPVYSSDSQEVSRRKQSNATADDTIQEVLPEELLGIGGAQDHDVSRSQEIMSRDHRMSASLRGVASDFQFEGFIDPGSLPDEVSAGIQLQETNLLLLRDETSENRSKLSDYLISFESTRDRVNRWILHRLRVSPREVYALQRRVQEHAPDVPDWAMLALREWPNDELGGGQSYHQGSIEADSDVPALPRRPHPPYPNLDPTLPKSSRPLRHALTTYSNAALAPTLSDLHNRTISSEQDIADASMVLEVQAALG
jgi:hypothetical protein